MKSFVAYPSENEQALFSQVSPRSTSGKLLAHIELSKRVRFVKGSIVKCGIAADEGFTRFMALKPLVIPAEGHNMIAFERFSTSPKSIENTLQIKIENAAVTIDDQQKALEQKGALENIEFVPGHVDDSIAAYLIHNPELKIAFLNIDLDDYDMTITSLEFFYPRLVAGGVLVVDNYYKHQAEYLAVNDYFAGMKATFNSYSTGEGPHYLFRK